MEELIDYTRAHSIIEIEKEHIKVYASVNQEMYCEENGLQPTGKFFIYLLDPGLGSIFFRMSQDRETGAWLPEGLPDNVNQDIIPLIIDALPV